VNCLTAESQILGACESTTMGDPCGLRHSKRNNSRLLNSIGCQVSALQMEEGSSRHWNIACPLESYGYLSDY
jgi:hypothetical protein